LTLINNAELTAEKWFVKITSNTARILIYNGNNGSITFNVSFIENVTSSVLTSIGPEGREFVGPSGGTIAITNEGSITGQPDSSLIYILAIIAAIIVVIIVFWVMRKKLFKSTSS